MAISKRYRPDNQSAYVERQRKAVPFTVERIGGPEALAAWKRDQARKEDEWEAGRETRYQTARERAINVLTGEKSVSPEIQKDIDAENNYQAILKAIKEAEHSRLVVLPDRPVPPLPSYFEEPKPSLLQRFKSAIPNFLSKIWKSAFDNS